MIDDGRKAPLFRPPGPTLGSAIRRPSTRINVPSRPRPRRSIFESRELRCPAVETLVLAPRKSRKHVSRSGAPERLISPHVQNLSGRAPSLLRGCSAFIGTAVYREKRGQ